jgi:four helix bundle protein
VRDFRRLDVWRDSIALGKVIYRLTEDFPTRERFGLVAQLRSSVVSISSNIAEGAGRGSQKELARFLRIAIGSICELESQIELAIELGMKPSPEITAQVDRTRRRLIRLVTRIQAS